MSAALADILARLRAAGVTVTPDPERPGGVIASPRDRLTDELRCLIRANKQELVAELGRSAARDLERRRAEVVARLKADSALRYAFDVQGAAPDQSARDVSVMLGLRDSAGTIVTGELCVPADRWPGLAVFTAYWRQAAEGRPS